MLRFLQLIIGSPRDLGINTGGVALLEADRVETDATEAALEGL